MKLDLDEKMEPLALDPREMFQVLANLVGNAIDACTLGDYVSSRTGNDHSQPIPAGGKDPAGSPGQRGGDVGGSPEKVVYHFFQHQRFAGNRSGIAPFPQNRSGTRGGNQGAIRSPTGRGISGHFAHKIPKRDDRLDSSRQPEKNAASLRVALQQMLHNATFDVKFNSIGRPAGLFSKA